MPMGPWLRWTRDTQSTPHLGVRGPLNGGERFATVDDALAAVAGWRANHQTIADTRSFLIRPQPEGGFRAWQYAEHDRRESVDWNEIPIDSGLEAGDRFVDARGRLAIVEGPRDAEGNPSGPLRIRLVAESIEAARARGDPSAIVSPPPSGTGADRLVGPPGLSAERLMPRFHTALADGLAVARPRVELPPPSREEAVAQHEREFSMEGIPSWQQARGYKRLLSEHVYANIDPTA